jgi:hypothetical protein
MQEAWIMFSLSFLIGFCGGAIGRILVTAWIARRCTKLENAVGDLQARQSTFKGKEMAKARWDKDAAFNAEMAQVLQSTPARTRKYDNDPLGE